MHSQANFLNLTEFLQTNACINCNFFYMYKQFRSEKQKKIMKIDMKTTDIEFFKVLISYNKILYVL